MLVIGIVVAVVVLFVIAKALSGGKELVEKPPHLRKPIAAGHFRVVGHDEVPGGDELTSVVGDYPSFDEALKEARAQRADSELRVGHKGQPTRYNIYNEKGELIGDWKGRK